jgi:hypothetical protein
MRAVWPWKATAHRMAAPQTRSAAAVFQARVGGAFGPPHEVTATRGQAATHYVNAGNKQTKNVKYGSLDVSRSHGLLQLQLSLFTSANYEAPLHAVYLSPLTPSPIKCQYSQEPPHIASYSHTQLGTVHASVQLLSASSRQHSSKRAEARDHHSRHELLSFLLCRRITSFAHSVTLLITRSTTRRPP